MTPRGFGGPRRANRTSSRNSFRSKVGAPSVLKSASFGYDGKGQHAIFSGDDPARVWRASAGEQDVLEKFIQIGSRRAVRSEIGLLRLRRQGAARHFFRR